MPKGPIKNRVFYYTAPRKLEIRTENCPPPGPGQVRCRTINSMVSIGTEMICFARQVEKGSGWDQWVQYPFEPGYLSIGEVVDVGRGVTAVKKGQRVASFAAHRAYFIDQADKVFSVPEGMCSQEANFFHISNIVQNGLRECKPVFGETAVVIGLGPLGQMAVRWLGVAGMRNLVAIDPMPMRCDKARGNGPTEVLCGYADKFIDRIMDLTGGLGAEMVFDITGNAAVFHAAHKMLGKRGRLGLIGDVPRPGEQTMTQDVIGKSVSIIAAHGAIPLHEGNHYYRWGKKEMTQLFFEFVMAGRFKVADLITHRIAPDEAPKVYPDICDHRDKYMGVIIDWSAQG